MEHGVKSLDQDVEYPKLTYMCCLTEPFLWPADHP